MIKRRSAIVSIVVVLAAAGGFTGYKMWNKPHTQVEDVKGMEVTATTLCSDFSANEAEATKKYDAKALEVTGTVGDVSNNQDGFPIVTLHGEDATSEVSCTMREKEVKLEPGAVATIKGFFSAHTIFGVSLTECVLVK